MIRLMIFLLAVLCAPAGALAQSNPAYAAITKEPVTENLRGIWAYPDCTRADALYVIAAHYIFEATSNMYAINPIQNVRAEDYDGETLYHLQANKLSLVMKLTNDGLVRPFNAPVTPRQPIYLAWGSQQDSITDEYTRCAKLFGTSLAIGQEEVNIPFIFDMIHEDCGKTTRDSFPSDRACHTRLFQITDYNQDEFLNQDELARLYRRIVFLTTATISKCNQKAEYNDTSKKDSADFAAYVMSHAAPDDPRGFTMTEIEDLLKRGDFISGPVYQFVENARNLQSLMPWLPAPDSQRTCLSSTPDNLSTLGTIESTGPGTSAPAP